MSLGKNIKTLREKANMSQEALAKTLGVTQQAIDAWERSKNDPRKSTIDKLATMFNVSTDFLFGRVDKNINLSSVQEVDGFIILPVIGEIRAGIPVLAEENILDYEKIPNNWVNSGDYLILEIVGDSMIDIGILPGGKVLIRQQDKCDSGDIAAVLIDDDVECTATLKRVFLHPERNEIELVPENRKYPRMYYPSEKIRICGIVKKAWMDY